jgi:hypothetical protein
LRPSTSSAGFQTVTQFRSGETLARLFLIAAKRDASYERAAKRRPSRAGRVTEPAAVGRGVAFDLRVWNTPAPNDLLEGGDS